MSNVYILYIKSTAQSVYLQCQMSFSCFSVRLVYPVHSSVWHLVTNLSAVDATWFRVFKFKVWIWIYGWVGTKSSFLVFLWQTVIYAWSSCMLAIKIWIYLYIKLHLRLLQQVKNYTFKRSKFLPLIMFSFWMHFSKGRHYTRCD